MNKKTGDSTDVESPEDRSPVVEDDAAAAPTLTVHKMPADTNEHQGEAETIEAEEQAITEFIGLTRQA